MYWTFGFIISLIVFIIIMGLLFFKAGREVLEEMFSDTYLGDSLNAFRMFENGEECVATGIFSLLTSFILLFALSLLFFFITWILWPLLVAFAIYFGIFVWWYKNKIKKKK